MFGPKLSIRRLVCWNDPEEREEEGGPASQIINRRGKSLNRQIKNGKKNIRKVKFKYLYSRMDIQNFSYLLNIRNNFFLLMERI